jgi:hypothetical protein
VQLQQDRINVHTSGRHIRLGQFQVLLFQINFDRHFDGTGLGIRFSGTKSTNLVKTTLSAKT